MISPCISAELIRGIREKLYHIEYCEYQEKKVEIPAGDRTMWEQSIFTKVWEFGKDGAAMVKKHYKNGLMLGVFLLAMFFLGRSIGAIAFGLHLQREMSIRETAGSALENTQALLSAENWGLGFGSEGTQPSGTASSDKLKEYNAYYVGDAGEKKIYLTFDCGYEMVIQAKYWMH